MNNLFLNGKPYQHSIEDLPCLIHYKEKEGGSFLTMVLLANLFSLGYKVLIFTAYPMAKETFLEQIGEPNNVSFIIKKEGIKKNSSSQALIIESGDEDLFIQTLNALGDINERIVLVKNFDIFRPETLKHTFQFEKLILSGNLDNCPLKDKVAEKKYDSIIAFSQPSTSIPLKVRGLDKYQGQLWSQSASGILALE